MTITVTTYMPCFGVKTRVGETPKTLESPRYCYACKWSIELDILSGAVKLVFMNPWSSTVRLHGVDSNYACCLTGHVEFFDSAGNSLGSETINLLDVDSSYEVAIPNGAVKAVFHIATFKPLIKMVTTGSIEVEIGNESALYSRVLVIQEYGADGGLIDEYQIDAYVVFFPIYYGRKDEVTGSVNTITYDASFSNIGDHVHSIGLYYREAKNVRITCTVYDEKDREITHYTVDHADSIHDVEEELMTDDAISSVTNPDTGAPYTWSDVRKITLKVEVIDSAKDASLDADWIFITKA